MELAEEVEQLQVNLRRVTGRETETEVGKNGHAEGKDEARMKSLCAYHMPVMHTVCDTLSYCASKRGMAGVHVRVCISECFRKPAHTDLCFLDKVFSFLPWITTKLSLQVVPDEVVLEYPHIGGV